MRNNIFEIINQMHNPLVEIQRIEELLNADKGVFVYDSILSSFDEKGTPTSIIKYVDDYLFRSWSQRGTCISCRDLKETLRLDKYDEDIANDSEFVLRYCEYAANILLLLEEKCKDDKGNNSQAALHNINVLLERYNFEVKFFRDKEKALVVPKNAESTAVAEILEGELSYSVIEYNHFLLKGDISKKKAILKALGDVLEPQREEITNLNKELSSNIFFMLNNLDIRHNNRSKKDPKNYKEYVAKMKKSKLEEWYDELYQCILLAFLLLDNTERAKKVSELKKVIKTKEN